MLGILGALFARRTLRKRGAGGSIFFTIMLALAPVLLVGLLVIRAIGATFADEKKKRR